MKPWILVLAWQSWKVKWTADEDKKLKCVRAHGEWQGGKQIAALVPGRSKNSAMYSARDASASDTADDRGTRDVNRQEIRRGDRMQGDYARNKWK
jgi:hypothetical protein